MTVPEPSWRRSSRQGHPLGGRTTRHLIGNDFHDYTLTFDHPPSEPMGSLCPVVGLAEYFHRRSDDGGTLRGIPGV
ncbi:MAG TPA: hypothetical protein VET27_18110 [Mycobacterium sp.]|nr:hypothetical protein [Mycobacterium sp.]